MKMWNLLIFWCDSEHSSVMKRSQWPACMTGVIHFKKAGHKLKTCEDYTFCNGQRVCYSQGVLFIDVLIVQRTIRATHYSMLLEDQINPTFRSKRRSRSVKKRLSPPRQRASEHRRCGKRNRKCIGRCCHTPPLVLTWCQAIFTC